VRVVLLHAYPFEPGMWDAQADALRAAGHDVLAPRLYDLPGAAMEEWATALEPVLDAGAVVAGASMGGYLALLLALRRPALVRTVALVGAKATGDTPERRAARDDTLHALATEGAPPDVEATADELARATRALRDRGDLDVSGLRIPLLVCIGTDDPIVPLAEAEALAETVRGAQLEVFAGGGHILTEDDPTRVTRLLLDFVERCT
jgi:pimeloyl-ACP methyl ester carboxylesterase